MRLFPRSRRAWLAIVSLLIVLTLLFLATSDNASIWPVRNTLLYRATRWWQDRAGPSPSEPAGVLYGCVHSAAGEPLPGATVIAAERGGTVHQAAAGADGGTTCPVGVGGIG